LAEGRPENGIGLDDPFGSVVVSKPDVIVSIMVYET